METRTKIKKPAQMFLLGDEEKIRRAILPQEDGTTKYYAMAFSSEEKALEFVHAHIGSNTPCLVVDKAAINIVLTFLANQDVEVLYDPEFIGTKPTRDPVTVESFESDAFIC